MDEEHSEKKTCDVTITVTPATVRPSGSNDKASVDETGSKKVKRSSTVSAKRNVLDMMCEWLQCGNKFDDVDKFHRHLKAHIETELVQNMKSLPESCRWFGCTFTQAHVDDPAEMIRHIYFHAFHARLKSQGEIYMKTRKWQGCHLDSETRNIIPELPDSLVCGWEHCGALHDSVELFYKHVSFHADNESEPRCQWNGCSTWLVTRSRLREHLRSHTQEKLVSCPNCGALFSNSTKLGDHLQRQQTGRDGSEAMFECFHCNKNFISERLLRGHMRHHVNHYRCTLCDMTCPTPSSLRNHIRYRHTTDTPYRCTQCQYAGKKAADLRRHMETHVPDDFYKCQVQDCDYSCKTYQTLTKHFQNAHEVGGKFECHLCSFQSSQGGQLTAHLQTVHQFKWPSGHTRFRFKLHSDGVHRLQMVRYESVQLSLIPDDKLAQSLSKEGVDVTNIQVSPERKRFSQPKKPRVRKRKKKTSSDTAVTAGGQETETVKSVKRRKTAKKKQTESESVNLNQSCEPVGVGNALCNNDVQGTDGAWPSLAYGDGGVVVPHDPYQSHEVQYIVDAPVGVDDTGAHASYTTCQDVLPFPAHDEKVESDQVNLEMLGEVALGFSGLFPKHNRNSPIKIWNGGFESPTKLLPSPDKFGAPIIEPGSSGVLETPEKIPAKSRKLDSLMEEPVRRRSPRKSLNPKRVLSL